MMTNQERHAPSEPPPLTVQTTVWWYEGCSVLPTPSIFGTLSMPDRKTVAWSVVRGRYEGGYGY